MTARFLADVAAALVVACAFLALGFAWGADSTPTEVVTRTRYVPVPMPAETTTATPAPPCSAPCVAGRGADGFCVHTGQAEVDKSKGAITPDPACGGTP